MGDIQMWLNAAVSATIALAFGTQLMTRQVRQDVVQFWGASLGTVGALCMLASDLVAHEGVMIGLKTGALILFVGSIVFYSVYRQRTLK